MELAALLIQRNQTRTEPIDPDYEEAEAMLWEALEVFDRKPAAFRAERRQVLEGLRTLYGRNVWDLPDDLAEIEAELARLQTFREPEAPE
jgi:hypothetical protein